MNTLQSDPKSWYTARYTVLGWLETGIKLIAIAFGVYALAQALSLGDFSLPAGLRLGQWVVLFVLSLGWVFAIFDRLRMRETISMVFVILNNFGHWGMVIALSTPLTNAPVTLFASLMLLGDIVKLIAFKTGDFSVPDVSKTVLYALTGFFVLGYALLLILQLAAN